MSRLTTRGRRAGFTLVEIMIVVFILGILVGLAIPNFLKARNTSSAKACMANLRQIQLAKDRWAMDTKALPTAVVTADDIYGSGKYIDQAPTCPVGGTYTIGTVNTKPTCSIEGHVLQ